MFILLKDNYNIFLTMCLFYITVKKQFLESLFIEQRDWNNVFFLECETDKNTKFLKSMSFKKDEINVPLSGAVFFKA